MKEDRELTKACYGVVSGGVASVLALAYWAFALKIKPDSIFGVGYLGNIKCYILLVGIFLTMFCICYGIMRICNLKIISNVYLNSIVGVVFLVLIATAVTPFLRDTWCFSRLTTIVIRGGGGSFYA